MCQPVAAHPDPNPHSSPDPRIYDPAVRRDELRPAQQEKRRRFYSLTQLLQFALKDIENIYDYTYALNAVKVGKPIEIEVLRKGKRIKLTVTPVSQR